MRRRAGNSHDGSRRREAEKTIRLKSREYARTLIIADNSRS